MKEIPNFIWKYHKGYKPHFECQIGENVLLSVDDDGNWWVFIKDVHGNLSPILDGEADGSLAGKAAAIDAFFGYFISLFEEVKKQFKTSYFG